MSVTMMLMVGFWAASSYIEYRIIKAFPQTKKVFDHAIGGIVLSISIGLFIGAVMGPVAGAGAALGQLLGLATNKMTYEMYAKGAEMSAKTKTKYHAFQDFTARNRTVITHAGNTIRLGAKSLGLLFVAFMFIIGLPFRLFEAIQKISNRAAAH